MNAADILSLKRTIIHDFYKWNLSKKEAVRKQVKLGQPMNLVNLGSAQFMHLIN